MRVVVLIGSDACTPASGVRAPPASDRGALALGMLRFGGEVRVYGADAEARCYARAAGASAVGEMTDTQTCVFDVALVGRGGCGERGDLLPALLAEQHGAALAYDVIGVDQDTRGLLVTRDLGRGARDVLRVRGSVVLVVADAVARGPYVSQHRLAAARVAGGEPVLREQPRGLDWEPTTPRVRLGGHASPVAGRAVERMNALFGLDGAIESTASIIEGSAEVCARHLLRYLSHHAFVDRGAAGEPDEPAGAPGEPRPALGRPQQAAAGAAPLPRRLQRRPRHSEQRPRATRGPFQIGVDI